MLFKSSKRDAELTPQHKSLNEPNVSKSDDSETPENKFGVTAKHIIKGAVWMDRLSRLWDWLTSFSDDV